MKTEIWDAYDKNENKLGFDLYRNGLIPKGAYHLVVDVCVFSADGKALITQRDENKTYPLKWENPGGSVLKGETPMQGAARELFEETGIAADEKYLRLAFTEVAENTIYKFFVAVVKGHTKIVLQPNETVDYKWLSYDEFFEFIKTDNFVKRNAESILTHKKQIDFALQKLLKLL